jgi:hypothetical protein
MCAARVYLLIDYFRASQIVVIREMMSAMVNVIAYIREQISDFEVQYSDLSCWDEDVHCMPWLLKVFFYTDRLIPTLLFLQRFIDMVSRSLLSYYLLLM